MRQFFLVCFFTGGLFALVSFVFGEIFNFDGFDTFDVDIQSDIPGSVTSPLRLNIIAAFAAVFGGVGLICLNAEKSILASLLLSLISAFLVASLLYRFLTWLVKSQNTSTIHPEKMIGMRAKANLGIKDNGFGEIMYEANKNSFSAPSRSVDGEDIPSGADVVIVDFKDGVFYIKEETRADS